MKTFFVAEKNEETFPTKTTIIIYGVVFQNGKTVVNWVGKNSSIVIWDNFSEFQKVSLNNENRKVIWFD